MRLVGSCADVGKTGGAGYFNCYKLKVHCETYKTHMPDGRVQREDE